MKTSEMSTKECLKAFLDSNGAAKGDLLAFVKANPERIPDWLDGKGPVGFNLVRLRVYLTEHGFVPSESSTIEDVVFKFGRIVAHRIITEEEARNYLGYSCMDPMLNVLLGKNGISEKVLGNMTAANDLYSQKLQPISFVVNESVQKAKVFALPAGKTGNVISREVALDSVAHAIRALKPFADAVGPEEIPEEARRQFRSLCGHDALVRLSTVLNRLLR